MWITETSIDIARPVEEVYQYLADFRRHKEWSRAVAEIEPVSPNGTEVVGAEFKAVETVPGKFTSYSRVTALEPHRRIAWQAWVEGMMRTEWTFELSPTDGGTRLVQRSGWEPTSLVSKAMLALMRKRQIPKENQQSLTRIKAILEGVPDAGVSPRIVGDSAERTSE